MLVERVKFIDLPSQVEQVAKVCTDAKLTGAGHFAEKLWGMGHYTPFEHNTFMVESDHWNSKAIELIESPFYNPAFRKSRDTLSALGSFRAWANLTGWTYDQLVSHLTWVNDSNRVTVLITTNIGISREIMRHRQFSFMERSTRYVKEFKFRPTKRNEIMSEQFKSDILIINSLAEQNIKQDLYRELLPLGTETTVYMTGWLDQYEDFFKLRMASSAHEGIQDISNQICRLI